LVPLLGTDTKFGPIHQMYNESKAARESLENTP
jgi:hypothetical protein